MIRHSVRIFWALLGCSALALGVLGIVLPLLPTTPFILLAAYAFARSSKPVHDWLLHHRIFGPLIGNWRRYGAISRRAKVAGVASLLVVFALSFLLRAPVHALLIQVLVLPLCAAFILSRPRPPAHTD